MSVAVIGAGAWGTALAAVLASDGTTVSLHGRDAATLAAIHETRENPRYLPGIALPALDATTELDTALAGAATVLLVVPVAATAQTVRAMAPILAADATVVCCSKGLDPEREETPAAIVARLVPNARVATLSGPSFAHDVAKGLPTAVTLGAAEMGEAGRLAALLSRPTFRLYAQDDLAGVELGGALKNVMALAVGTARGLRLGASAEAAVIARGFSELVRIAVALGARRDTLHGLSGLGDLVLSCASEQSRNFAYGVALGEGRSTEGLPLAEGVRTAATAARISRREGLDCAIVEGMARLLAGEVEAKALVEELLARPLRQEGDGAQPSWRKGSEPGAAS